MDDPACRGGTATGGLFSCAPCTTPRCPAGSEATARHRRPANDAQGRASPDDLARRVGTPIITLLVAACGHRGGGAMETMRAAEQLEGLVRPLAALAAGTVASPPFHRVVGPRVARDRPHPDRVRPADSRRNDSRPTTVRWTARAVWRCSPAIRRAANAERAREARGTPEGSRAAVGGPC